MVGHTDESGVTLPPLHPRCRCAIMYREVGSSNTQPKQKPSNPNNAESDFEFDFQRFGGQPLPEGDYNLNIRERKQARHIEGTPEYLDYVRATEGTGFKPSKLPAGTDTQALVKEFHGKGIYDPNPRDGSARERVDTGRIIGQYWNRAANQYDDTSWLEIVYSKKGAHVYPNYPPKED